MAADPLSTKHSTSARRRLEDDLTEGRYCQILDVLGEGIILADEEEHLRFCNPACESIFETTMEELIGKSLLDFVIEEDQAKVLFQTGKRREGVCSSYEIRIQTAKGNVKHVLLTASPLGDPLGKYDGAVGTVLDITGRKKAEEELRQFAGELARSNELKELFGDILRHDLLGPVTIVKAYAETLLETDAAPSKEFLNIILENAGKLEGIIESASQLAKLEARGELEKEPLNISALLKDTMDSLKKAASDKDVSVSFAGEEDVTVRANPIIAEVFWNLISNAIKYCPSATPVVVSLSNSPGEALISIANRGEDIPDEAKQSIFERFKRASRGPIKGSGLGLAIAKRVVELHAGKIWVEDNPEGGAIFLVSLPN